MNHQEEKSLGIGKAVLICLVFYLIFLPTEFLYPQISKSFGLEFDYPTKLFIQLLLSWPIAIWIGLRFTGQTFNSVFSIKTFSPRLLIPLFFLLFGLATILLEIAGLIPMSEEMQKSLAQNHSQNPMMMLGIAVLIAPIAEEIFFRGILLKGFLGRYSVRKSIFASAILFGLFHLNPWQLVLAVPMGIILAVLVLRTGSLLTSIYGHFVINAAPNLLFPLVFKTLGYSKKEMEIKEHYPIWFLLLAILLFAAGWFLLKRQGFDFRLGNEKVGEK